MNHNLSPDLSILTFVFVALAGLVFFTPIDQSRNPAGEVNQIPDEWSREENLMEPPDLTSRQALGIWQNWRRPYCIPLPAGSEWDVVNEMATACKQQAVSPGWMRPQDKHRWPWLVKISRDDNGLVIGLTCTIQNHDYMSLDVERCAPR